MFSIRKRLHLDDVLSDAGIVAFNLLATSIFMFAAITQKTYIVIPCVIFIVLVVVHPADITQILYGHLCMLRMADLSWGLMPCMMFYGMSAIPYVIVHGNAHFGDPIAPERFIILLIIEGIIYYVATRKLLDRYASSTVYLVALLLCSYAHNGPYAWIVYMEELPMHILVWRALAEVMVPMIVVVLMSATASGYAFEEDATKKTQ